MTKITAKQFNDILNRVSATLEDNGHQMRGHNAHNRMSEELPGVDEMDAIDTLLEAAVEDIGRMKDAIASAQGTAVSSWTDKIAGSKSATSELGS